MQIHAPWSYRSTEYNGLNPVQSIDRSLVQNSLMLLCTVQEDAWIQRLRCLGVVPRTTWSQTRGYMCQKKVRSSHYSGL